MDTLTRSKSMAKALRKALADRHVDLPHSACLEIVARQFGFSNWNVLKNACNNEARLSTIIFVEHGRQEEAAAFYAAAFDAVRTASHRYRDALMAVELRVGETTMTVSGSNPRRESEPARGGPFFPKERGKVSAIFRLEVSDVEGTFQKAVAAGAVVRDQVQVGTDGRRAGAFFDPFGHIWGVSELTSQKGMRAA